METHRQCRRSRRWIREQWRSHVEAQASSGLSGEAYCRLHGLRAKSFYRWRRVLASTAASGNDVASKDEPARAVFAEFRVRDVAHVPEHPVAEGWARVEVVAQGGRAIRVWPGFDGETLARTVAVLEGLCTPEACEC